MGVADVVDVAVTVLSPPGLVAHPTHPRIENLGAPGSGGELPDGHGQDQNLWSSRQGDGNQWWMMMAMDGRNIGETAKRLKLKAI